MEEDLYKLWNTMLMDLSMGYDCVSTSLDLETVQARLNTEGISFLTITLPSFGKALEKALDQGRIFNDQFIGWKKLSTDGRSPLPAFLSGFMERVFDRKSGVLLDNPDIDSIFAVRQLTLMFSKIGLECSQARKTRAISGYLECEQEVRRFDAEVSSGSLEAFMQSSRVIFGTTLQQVDECVYYGGIIPKHGPGATADRLVANAKFQQVEWTERLERIFPVGEFLVPNYRYHFDILSRINFLEPGAERPVRVILVPKTLKTPRIIAIEPTCMQYAQQGLMHEIVESLESEYIRSHSGVRQQNPAYGFVGFSDQVPNQKLAREGSLKGELATLDLSEASDRVSNQLVREMLAPYPYLQEGVDACRSRKADVPGHGVIRLAKFASMGSALTFPVEAMVFTTIIFMAIAEELRTSVSHRLLKEFEGKVRVYGDDIIVPTDYAVPVMRKLETFGFKVNADKSFWTGKFRESCGKEYYAGHDVSIHRVRQTIPTELAHVQEILSTVAFRNHVYGNGLWSVARYLDKILGRILKGNYPRVAETSPVIGRHSVPFGYETQTMSEELHAPRVRGYVVNSKTPVSKLDGIDALLKCLLKQGHKPFADKEHLTRGGRPKAVSIKLRNGQPF